MTGQHFLFNKKMPSHYVTFAFKLYYEFQRLKIQSNLKERN